MTILVLGHQRCGSSNFTRFFRAAFKIRATLEPLNQRILGRDFPGWRYATRAQLVNHVESVFSSLDMCKHIYGQHIILFDQLLIENPFVNQIILLRRDTLEEAALSSVIARKLGDFNKQASTPIGRIEPSEVEAIAEKMKLDIDHVTAVCSASGKPVITVSYEAIYREARRKENLQNLVETLEYTTTASQEIAYSRFIDAGKKVNSVNSFRQIENLEELKKSLPALEGILP